MASILEELDAKGFAPLYFSGIQGYPTEFLDSDWDEHIAKFHRQIDSTTLHVASFIEFTSKLNAVHKDVVMKKFALTFEDSTKLWFENLGRKEILSSFIGLIQAYQKCWDLSYEEEEQVEDLVDAYHYK